MHTRTHAHTHTQETRAIYRAPNARLDSFGGSCCSKPGQWFGDPCPPHQHCQSLVDSKVDSGCTTRPQLLPSREQCLSIRICCSKFQQFFRDRWFRICRASWSTSYVCQRTESAMGVRVHITVRTCACVRGCACTWRASVSV